MVFSLKFYSVCVSLTNLWIQIMNELPYHSLAFHNLSHRYIAVVCFTIISISSLSTYKFLFSKMPSINHGSLGKIPEIFNLTLQFNTS